MAAIKIETKKYKNTTIRIEEGLMSNIEKALENIKQLSNNESFSKNQFIELLLIYATEHCTFSINNNEYTFEKLTEDKKMLSNDPTAFINNK